MITIFEQTPLLPTYLFGLVISDFTVSSTHSGEISFAVLSRPEQAINTQFALETGAKALELFESAFETKYELEKLDQVALPGFNRGSMENHGIIFYDEDILLVEPGVSALRSWLYCFDFKPKIKFLLGVRASLKSISPNSQTKKMKLEYYGVLVRISLR